MNGKSQNVTLAKLGKRAPRKPGEVPKLEEIAAHESDVDRAAKILAGHSILVVAQMAKEQKLSRRAQAAMLANMADAHTRAAARLGREALRQRLIAEGGKG